MKGSVFADSWPLVPAHHNGAQTKMGTAKINWPLEAGVDLDQAADDPSALGRNSVNRTFWHISVFGYGAVVVEATRIITPSRHFDSEKRNL